MATTPPRTATAEDLRPGAVQRARRHIGEVWRSRELLVTLVSVDLKVRYRNSILGFAWSMFTPLAMMGIFTFIFTQVFRAPIRDFPIFFLAAFLPWQYFANSAQGAVGTIVGNANLIKKVYFPREILPTAHVLSQGIHFLLALVVFLVVLVVRGDDFWVYLPLLVPVIALHTVFTAGVSMAFAAANVVFRDLQELTQVLFLLWFYATPVIYSFEMVPGAFHPFLKANPMTTYVTLYRRALYDFAWPSPTLWFAAVAIAVVAFVIGYAAFSRLAITFAKEI